MATEVGKFQDPYTMQEYPIVTVNIKDLKPSPYQREISSSLVNSLVNSIIKVGFISIPLVYEENGSYYVIDGMHRIEALKNLVEDGEITCILVPNEKQYIYSVFYNTEKPSNIKEKSRQVYKMYIEELNSGNKEKDYKDMFDVPYYITCGICLSEINSKFSPFLFESLLKKLDKEFFDDKIDVAYKKRKKMAQKMNEVFNKINERYNEIGLTDFFMKGAILSRAVQNVYGMRVREIPDDFNTVMAKILKEIPNISF